MQPGLAIVVMGVSGCGKSLIAGEIAQALGAALIEGDDLHSPTNRDKMAGGVPLTDADRAPWLDRVGTRLGADARQNGVAVATCSALKASYRRRLADAARIPLHYVYLTGPRQVLADRLAGRHGHFMDPALLDSQIATLEPPERPLALEIDIRQPSAQIVAQAIAWLQGD